MHSSLDSLLAYFGYAEPVLCGMLLFFLVRSKAGSPFGCLVALLCVRFTCSVICLPLLYLCGRGIEKHLAYQMYFYVYWTSYALEAVLSLLVIYGIFRLAMAPLKGLQTLGRLSDRTRIFGVSLCLGFLASVNLVNSAWIAHNPNIYSVFSVINGMAVGLTLLTWSLYFAFPEPKRQIIVLPTTSPFLRWNQISMALGDDPGYVAVGGIPPELFAPAELEVMRRASAKMPTGLESSTSLQSLSA